MHKSGVIEYKHDDYECEGFAVWDDAGNKRPGILVFPEWVGVGEYTHKRAQMLGDLGFNAFVSAAVRMSSVCVWVHTSGSTSSRSGATTSVAELNSRSSRLCTWSGIGVNQISTSRPTWWLVWPESIGPPRGCDMSPTRRPFQPTFSRSWQTAR